MGQLIQVEASPLGAVTLFSTDRSLTGQDGVSLAPGASDGADPPHELARRLFDADDLIDHVHVLSNTVAVRRRESWDEEAVDRARDVIANLFVHYGTGPAPSGADEFEQLRVQNYNATLSHIRAHNEDLWVMRVTPDQPIDPFLPGQYTTLALGYWEPRADDAHDNLKPDQDQKMARRSYSVSSSMIDETGELLPPHTPDVEFYIVKVKPGQEEIPALTPRLFMKDEGDRLYMGRKFTGHYTLEGVSPDDNIVFLSTGTGEAPQNAMIAELLRKGHEGHMLNVVCVRYRSDLAYTEQHAVLVDRYSNYKYVTITTREPENEGKKVYIQDLVTSSQIEKELGAPMDPDHTHVFLCGNPAMIGLPKWTDDGMVFPETLGVCQQLHEKGFTIDHRKERGNVHYEEYWTDR
ncbi:MAG TPA: ferredoxin--NADP reductase [Acidimicrobiia bacterium]|nr:ferredoxin--NADP reductase [Acidimicrobiia bacterium]